MSGGIDPLFLTPELDGGEQSDTTPAALLLDMRLGGSRRRRE
jgi:hypothetical protein